MRRKDILRRADDFSAPAAKATRIKADSTDQSGYDPLFESEKSALILYGVRRLDAAFPKAA